MPSPNKQSQIETFSRDPNLASISAVDGQLGINIANGTLWQYDATNGLWIQRLGAIGGAVDPTVGPTPGADGQLYTNTATGSVWVMRAGTWVQFIAPSAATGAVLVGSNSWVQMTDNLDSTVLNDARHYVQVLAPGVLTELAAVLNGTTLNSAGNVIVTVVRLPTGGGAPVAVGVFTFLTTEVAGTIKTISLGAPQTVAVGDMIRATVTTQATVAGGTFSVSFGLVG